MKLKYLRLSVSDFSRLGAVILFIAVSGRSFSDTPADPKAAPVSSATTTVETPPSTDPFSFADFSWLNGNSRQKYALLDYKYFTGEFLADTNYIYDFNHPIDHTLIGATAAGRTNEFQVQQLGVGGDLHFEHVRGRFMTQFGMYSTMTPRNDGSPARGQWDLADAYRYISEAYGGYHWDTLHGINLDVGIFMSYIGLFSYYNVENWAYQASYVSANTPWFFNGVRLQIFPTDRLKTEFWLINGWQSYGMFNEQPGLGYQVLYRPDGNNSFVFNGYYGYDTQDFAGRMRLHSDNSYQYKYLDRPSETFSKAAFSVTVDLGCENGGGVKCIGGDAATPSQYFAGFMVYNRIWFSKDKFALTIGGGAITNPGRYLVLLPPIGGAGATNYGNTNANNVFPVGPGQPFKAWDGTVTFDYMPDQFVTFRIEYNHREASVAYFAGPGGITSGDGYSNNGTNGTAGGGWTPNLVQTENRVNCALMVRL